jgi:hypothetical protein
MTRIIDPDIPPNLVELVRPILVLADGAYLHAATGYLNPWCRKVRMTHSHAPSLLVLESVARVLSPSNRWCAASTSTRRATRRS